MVETGPARFEIDPHGSLKIALKKNNGERTYTPVASTLPRLGAFIQKGERQQDTGKSGQLVRGHVSIMIEESGSLYAVVRIAEDFVAIDGCRLVLQHRLVFYRNKSFFRAFHTVTNKDAGYFNGIDQPGAGSCFLKAVSLDLRLDDPRNAKTVILGGDSPYQTTLNAGGTVKLYQDSSGSDHWKVPGGPYTFRGYRIYNDGTEIASGKHASGWMDVSSETMGVTVAVRHFWQNNPKKLQVSSDGVLSIGLWPDEFSKFHWIFGGFQKTHEVLYYFHASTATDAGAAQVAAAFQDPLFAQTSPAYYITSGAFGDTINEDRVNFADYERMIDAQIDPKAGDSYRSLLVSNVEKWNVYGTEFFGDTDQETDTWTWTTRQMSNLEQDVTQAMLLAFARKGNLRFLDVAIPMARHIYDIDINHATTGTDYDRKYDGANRKHGTYHIDNGAELTHVWIRGLLTYYYLTGDVLAFEGARRIADNVVYRINSNRDAANNEERVPGWSIKVLVQFYDATHEQKYLDAALAMKDKVLALQHPIHGYFDGEKNIVNPWMCGVLVEALYELWEVTGRSDKTLRTSITNFTAWLKNEAWNESYQAFPNGWMPKSGGYSFSTGDQTVNTFMVVDAMVIGYWLTGDSTYWHIAEKAFYTGSHYPWGSYYVGYGDAKISAKSMLAGHRYLYQKAKVIKEKSK